MKSLLLFAALCLPLISHAQTEDNEPKILPAPTVSSLDSDASAVNSLKQQNPSSLASFGTPELSRAMQSPSLDIRSIDVAGQVEIHPVSVTNGGNNRRKIGGQVVAPFQRIKTLYRSLGRNRLIRATFHSKEPSRELVQFFDGGGIGKGEALGFSAEAVQTRGIGQSRGAGREKGFTPVRLNRRARRSPDESIPEPGTPDVRRGRFSFQFLQGVFSLVQVGALWGSLRTSWTTFSWMFHKGMTHHGVIPAVAGVLIAAALFDGIWEFAAGRSRPGPNMWLFRLHQAAAFLSSVFLPSLILGLWSSAFHGNLGIGAALGLLYATGATIQWRRMAPRSSGVSTGFPLIAGALLVSTSIYLEAAFGPYSSFPLIGLIGIGTAIAMASKISYGRAFGRFTPRKLLLLAMVPASIDVYAVTAHKWLWLRPNDVIYSSIIPITFLVYLLSGPLGVRWRRFMQSKLDF